MASKLKRLLSKTALLLLIIAALLTGSLSALLSACGPPSLAFESITISPAIDEKNSEPLEPSAEYDMKTRHIFATIKYRGVRGGDSWRFKWIYRQTGETILDNGDKYNADEPEGYFQGTVNSSIYIAEGNKIIPPGSYTVKFYHNGRLESSADFNVSKPQMKIMEITLSNEIDEKGAPKSVLNEFRTTETVFACIKADYVISGNTLKALWKDSRGNTISEAAIDIEQDYYEQSYVWFSLELAAAARAEPVKPGSYSVEILLNNVIADKLDFTVIKGELVTFEHGISYTNDDYGFTISIPDNWTFKENPSDNAIMIVLIPEKYIITRFAFIAAPSKPVKPYDKFAEEDAAGFAEENSWTQISSQSRDYSLANGDPVKQIMYLHQDGQGKQYATAYTFIEHSDNVYILYAAADKESAGEVTEAAYFGILQSLVLR